MLSVGRDGITLAWRERRMKTGHARGALRDQPPIPSSIDRPARGVKRSHRTSASTRSQDSGLIPGGSLTSVIANFSRWDGFRPVTVVSNAVSWPFARCLETCCLAIRQAWAESRTYPHRLEASLDVYATLGLPHPKMQNSTTSVYFIEASVEFSVVPNLAVQTVVEFTCFALTKA